MKKFIIFGLVLAVAFSLVALAQEEETETLVISTSTPKPVVKLQPVETKPVELKYKPEKVEIKIPALTPRQLGEFKKLDDFVREEIAEHPRANFFFLGPSDHASQQGVVDQNQNNILTVNSQGFKMNWRVATDTQVIAAQRVGLLGQVNPQVETQNINVGSRVRVFGIWDGNNLVVKRVVVLEPRRAVPQVQAMDLLQKVQEAFKKAGLKVDLTSIFQQLQQLQSAPTPAPTTPQQ